ncbi:hypothetical protein B0A52_02972 [Exophiala mesophila]|uniref:Uncharacterized protein n=1 Tax=Exophiala mesophila TaxID=212818 RepID=A0A438NCH9_EXOME|nr:hypothetical protein B0A52_02972 [Exophiala mesophila]
MDHDLWRHSRPYPAFTATDQDGLLSSKAPARNTVASAMEPSPYQQRFDARRNFIADDDSESYNFLEPATPFKEPPPRPSTSTTANVLRKITIRNPMSRSVKRSQGQEYASLDDDGDLGTPQVDLSSLAGMGWEMNDMSGGQVTDTLEPDTEYNVPGPAREKPKFREFVDKQHSLGEGMRDVGVQLRRDRTKLVRRSSAEPSNADSTGIDRARTVRELGQNLAQKKNIIVEVEEAIDLSVLEGGHHDNRVNRSFTTPDVADSAPEPPTKSYFFPEDPQIPNWKPWSLRSPYILSLLILALGLAGFQEFLCQRSIQLAEKGSGILAFNEVDEVSTLDFFAWKYLPTMITIIYAVMFSIMDFDIRRLEPFYQLSQPGGAKAGASLNLDHLTMFQYFVPFKAFRLKQWAVMVSTTGNILASMLAPALQNPSVDFQTNGKCTEPDSTCPDGETRYWVRIDGVWSRLLSASYVLVAIVLVILFIQLRRKSGLLSDPKGIAGIASMATKSHILQDFAGLDEANRGEIHKRLQHRRYVLYKSSIWQGEWSASSEVSLDSEKKLTSPHPYLLRTNGAIPFLIFMGICLACVPLITLTPARAVPNSAPWLPIVVATLLKLLFNTFETDVRLMEPFYVLSNGNARPEDSLTLDYQSTVYGILPFKALFNRHYLVALVGFSSVLLDVLTVTVSSFSVDSQKFLTTSGGDSSDGDETYVSFWASLALSVSILVFVIFVTTLVYIRRRHPFLPREPSTIAAVLAFVYASNMLEDFIDTETLNNKQMEIKLKSLNKRYGLGWFKGRDGKLHCAVDEEPMKSRYVHGKPYSMAQAGPLQPADTFYTV